jgi:DNA repair protein RecO (recombination protein O)
MEWTDTALVLRVGKFRETDLWINLLTKDRGIVFAFAFGGSRSRRRFCGCFDLLNIIRVRAKSSRAGAYINLQEGSLLSGPRRLRKDWPRLGMLMNCVRFVEALGVAPDNSEGIFILLRKMVDLFENAPAVHSALPTLFRLRMASDQGYAPDFSICGICGNIVRQQSGIRLKVNEGQIICSDCALASDSAYIGPHIGQDAHRLLCAVQREDPDVWNECASSLGGTKECLRVTDEFIQYHLGLIWQDNRFIHI